MERESGVRVRLELLRLSALVVREEDEAALIDTMTSPSPAVGSGSSTRRNLSMPYSPLICHAFMGSPRLNRWMFTRAPAKPPAVVGIDDAASLYASAVSIAISCRMVVSQGDARQSGGKRTRLHPIARAISHAPAATLTTPIARAANSPFGAKRSTVIAAVTNAITRRSITPTTSRIAIKPAQQ